MNATPGATRPDEASRVVQRLACTADIHIDGGRWGGTNPATGRSRAAENTWRIWLEICERAVAERACLVVAGDLFLNGHPLPEHAEMLADGLRTVSRAGLEAVVVRGNHDPKHLPLAHRDPLARFADLPGVTVATEPCVVPLASGVQVVCLPWPRAADLLSPGDRQGLDAAQTDALVAQRAAEVLDELIEEAARSGAPIVVAAHCTVDRATLGSPTRGSEVSLGQLVHEPVLPLSAFDRPEVAHVALGHIHRRQQLAERVWYCGSPDRLDFGEENQDKAWSLVTVHADGSAEVEAVPTNARRFRTIDLSHVEGSDPDEVLHAVEERLDAELASNEGAVLRVRLPAGAHGVERRLHAAAQDNGALVAQVMSTPAPHAEEGTTPLPEDVDVLDGLRAWLETVDQEQLGVSPQEVLKVAAELLHQDTQEPLGEPDAEEQPETTRTPLGVKDRAEKTPNEENA